MDGLWVALLAWSSSALKCAVRDNFIGWSEEKRIKRLKYITNNVRFLILPWVRVKNLASRILSLNLKRLIKDYETVYAHPVYIAETFVDMSHYKGTCYRAANFIYLGKTKDFSKNGRYYYLNRRLKGVFVYPLIKDAPKILNAELLPEGGKEMKLYEILSINELPIEELVDVIKRMTDPGERKGIRYPLFSLLGLAICSVFCEARIFIGIGEWVKNLSKEILMRFGIKRGTYPDESTIRRAIQRINAEEFDRLISEWLLKQGIGFKDKAIAIDGKRQEGSRDEALRPVHILSAIIHKEGVVIGSRNVDEKTTVQLIKGMEG
jgi:hypothetical protein